LILLNAVEGKLEKLNELVKMVQTKLLKALSDAPPEVQ